MLRTIIILFTLSIVLSLSSCSKKQGDENMEHKSFNFKDILFDEMATEYNINEKGCIRDVETAIIFADTIFISIFGDGYNNWDLPLIAYFDESEDLWMVQTQLPDDILVMGGCTYIIFKKSNAEIIAIWGTL